MRALEVKSWKDFVKGGFHFDRFRRFKMDEAEEIKDKERKSRKKKRHGDSRSDGKNHKNESNILSETEKGTGDQKLRHNLLDRKKEILKGLEVNTHEGDFTKDFPSYIIRCTKNKPSIKFSENPANATYHLQNRQQMLATLLPEIEAIVLKFLSAMKPKKLKENCYADNYYNNIDEKLLVMMKDKNIYPFKGWWPKTSFIITQVKEDPNIEIDEDVFMNEITTSKRTKKSRFNDDTSHVELRPTVPSKWDSDYDGSPAAENKIAYVGVTQSEEINTNDNVCTIQREENNLLDISHQEEAMDTASDVGEDEPKIEVNVCPALPVQDQEPQGHTKLNTEYEEFLKIVKVDKVESEPASIITTQKDNENNLSMKSSSLNDDSIQDESDEYMSTKSSVESGSLQNVVEESDSNDKIFIEELPHIDLKLRSKKKSSSKKSRSFKNKESKKKRHKSSSSESSQDSETESDSSSDDSDSESSDSTSTVEKKKKKKSKNKKKRKTKTNYKKKHRGDKNKTKSPEDEKDANSSIINLIEKALNVEIKKRPSDSKEPKQKKKKRKHEKNKHIANEENDDKFEKVKDCLKETITKLVKTEKVNKNQSLSCDDTVIEVLKYLNDKEKKNKKSKKSLKRKHDSDISDDEKTPKKSRLVDSCSKPKVNEKKKKSKKKKSVDSDEYMTKKKSKKKSKTTDTSEAEDVEVLIQNKSNDSVQFFELRPNEWNIIKKSSRRGVVHHSEVENKNKTSPVHNTIKRNENIKQKKSDSLGSIEKYSPTNITKNNCEIPKLLDVFKEHVVEKERIKQLLKPNKIIKSDKIDNVSKNIVEEKILINFTNSDSEPNEEVEKCIEENDEMSNKSADKCPNDIFKLKNDLQQSIFLKNDNSEQHNMDKDLESNFKPQTQSTPPIDPYDKPHITCTTIKAVTETISYRDKVKMNLKKLSSCQNIPFVFGFSSPISLIKSNNFIFDKSKDLKVTKEKEKSNEDERKVDDPKINETQLSESDKPKVINLSPTQMEIPDVTKKELHKNNIETNDKTLDHSYDWDDSEESDTDQSLITSTNSSEHSSDEGESEQIYSNLLKNDSPNICNINETFSNYSESKELEEIESNVFETNSSSESVIKEKELPLEVEHFLIEKQITTSSNFADFSKQNLDYNTEGLQNDVISVKMDEKDSDPVYSQRSSIDIIEVTKSNNELITQWTSDWINLDKSVTEINHSSNSKSGDEELQLKKKSRWDEQPMDNSISKSQKLNNGQEEYKYETETNNLTHAPKDTNYPTNNEDDLYNEQNQTCEIMSINCMNDYNEINPYVYDDYSQTYEQYSGIPMYSEMKTIDHDLLSPVDYSVYENFNPNYNYHTEDYEMWKSVDTDTSEYGMIKAIPTTDETVSHLIDVFENVPSENISIDQVEFLQEEVLNENTDTIISDPQEEIVKNEKSDSASHDELFVKLYHQHFQHYNQNPIKYSLSDPVIISTDNVEVNFPDISTSQEKLSEIDQKSDDIISIPLQARAYVCILEDDNTNLYLTSDNYMAYCAVEDRCMVHISVNACSRDGVGNDVRHCFNVSLNGSIHEYWLHADLIPFHVPSDAESGVFSDDEMDSLDSDSGHEEDVDNDNNENDDHIIESEWELVDNIHDNVNSWLDEPYILKKYNIEHDDSHINQEHYVTSSSECDTDGSEFSDSYVEMFNDKQNINENHFHKSHETKDDKHIYQNVFDVVTPTNVSENTENSDLLVETDECIKSSEQLVLDVEIKNDMLEVNENNLTSKIKSGNNDVLGDLVEKVNNDNASVMLEENENNYENESGLCMKEEVTVADLSMMDTIINQKILIQKLKIRAKEKVREKLPDTIMIRYSDNMETIKYPFLGLFQPPTNSILSKPRSTKPTRTSNLSKRVTFADGIRPGDNLAASPTHDDVGRPLSPPPLKRLMRETLKFKRNMYPFKKTKVRTKLTMVKKKVAKVTPSIKETNPSVIEYYISRRRLGDLPIGETPNSSFLSSNHSSNTNNESTEKMSTPPRPTREVTPVPSDTECWNDDDTIKNNR
ncbi:protein PFC0760c isoform X2 [Acyrthosiphon pisum]|nr:protein PFC0760c isoform X2 [Acyrthosiphon pisum]|eukprot:XP_008186499.1 PREDICTED: uncharacterized protein PF11_0213 isoform X2 [Acyrthosiphon pisum]